MFTCSGGQETDERFMRDRMNEAKQYAQDKMAEEALYGPEIFAAAEWLAITLDQIESARWLAEGHTLPSDRVRRQWMTENRRMAEAEILNQKVIQEAGESPSTDIIARLAVGPFKVFEFNIRPGVVILHVEDKRGYPRTNNVIYPRPNGPRNIIAMTVRPAFLTPYTVEAARGDGPREVRVDPGPQARQGIRWREWT